MINNVMVDLETMSTASNAAIISIGAVHFNKDGTLADEFYTVVDLQSSMNEGLIIDGSTVTFWLGQSDAARNELLFNSFGIRDALLSFSGWIGDDAIVWGNGAAFDNVILKNAYEACDFKTPWKFYNDRCYRTIKNIYPDIDVPFDGVEHCAVDDARYQARRLIKINADAGLGAL